MRTVVRFYIVDVFAETKFSGNQLAIFRDCKTLSTAMMMRIANEMHYSETTFVTSEKPAHDGYNVRIFTPSSELPFAGHPTLGTALIVQSEVIGRQVPEVRLNMKAGQIPVTFSYKNGRAGTLWMRQNEPRFGEELEPARVANMLGLSPADIDRRFPAMEVSTGLPFVIVPLKDMTSLKRARLDVEGFRRLVGRSRPESRRAEGVLVFSPETYHEKNDLNVRVLVPGLGVVIEDPATGSANACLAAYLARNRYSASQEVDARVEQGYEIGRKSLLLLRASIRDKRIEVDVGGQVQFIARGELED